MKHDFQINDYLSRGGFPRSLLAAGNKESFEWREDFIATFLERDLLLWSGFSPATMRRLWQMIANLNGKTVNYSYLGSALGVSHTTVRNYIELLGSTFMLQILPPFQVSTGKRLVKSPKIYLNDTGIANALLRISDFDQLSGHPSFGAAWESLVLINLTATFPQFNYCFYRTGHGAEIDIVMENGPKCIAIECKASLSPKLSAGTYAAIEDIQPAATLVVAPVEKGWSMKNNIRVVNISEAITFISGSGTL